MPNCSDNMHFFRKKDKNTDELPPTEVELVTDETYLKEEKVTRLKRAEIMVQIGRYEEAAGIYETLAMDFEDETFFDKAKELFYKAKELRDKACGFQVKFTSVDVNELTRQLKESGLAVAYKCPTCSASLSINGDTKSESLNKCSYCGSKIENLADLLKEILH